MLQDRYMQGFSSPRIWGGGGEKIAVGLHLGSFY